MAKLKIVLRDENNVELEVIEAEYADIAEAGVIERNGEFYTYQSLKGQFFTTPIFQRVKKVTL